MRRFVSSIFLLIVSWLPATVSSIACSSDTTPTAPSTPPASTLSLSGSLAFGDVTGGSSRDLAFTISNTGTSAVTVSGVTAPTGFAANWTSGTLAAGGGQSVTVRFTPTADQSYSGVVSVNATTGSSSIPVSGRGIRTGHVVDASGDARAFTGVTVSPDLVDAQLAVTGAGLTVTLTFATGTMSQMDTRAAVYIDVDESPASGRPGTDSSGTDTAAIGVEYTILLNDARSSRTNVTRMRQSGSTWFADTVGTTGLTFPTPDRMSATVPLSFLGGDDGRVAFKIAVDQYRLGVAGDVQSSLQLDNAPDSGSPAALTP